MSGKLLITSLLSFVAFSYAAGPQGSWSVVGDSGVVCIHSALLPGPEPAGTRYKILCAERPHAGKHRPYLTNQKTGGETTTEVDVFNKTNPFVTTHVSRNPFCGGQSQMADGRIYMAGGDRSTIEMPNDANFLLDGRTARRIYTPLDQIAGTTVQPWTHLPDMTVQRWYPTIIILPTGTHLIVSGSLDNLDLSNITLTTNNPTYEYYPPLPGEPRLTLGILDRAHPWSLYPLVYLLPKSGKVFIFAGKESAILDTKTNIADETSIPMLNDSRTFVKIYPFTPTGVLMPLTIANDYTATVRLCGGTQVNNQSAPFCFEIQPEATGAQWTEVDPLPRAKVMPDVVILPDAKILYVNGAEWGTAGGDGGEAWNAHPPAFDTFLYDPSQPSGSRYTSLAKATVGRLYHSGALLAPDGRVLTVGSEMANWPDIEANRTECYPFVKSENATTACTDPFETRVEAFEPPYFNVANRISIDLSRAPRNVTHGSYIQIYLSKGFESRAVSHANFIRYGSTTHSTNADQRLVEAKILSFNSANGRYVIEVPNSTLMPPGNYMLWLIDDAGIPCEHSATILVSLGEKDTSTSLDAKWVAPTAKSTSSSSSVKLIPVPLTFVTFLLIGVSLFWSLL
ncbi:hypothetical protein HK098_007598 [Nowakowskiella sp. JEL0407]|nr:hypothetical protein HK098_007598 [Nowakowskiella sp. JEL0407]